MNAQNSAFLNHSFWPISSDYRSLAAVALKDVITYALETGDVELCIDIRENIVFMKSLNLLIVDEHNAFWQQLVWRGSRYCNFVIAGSQLHEFESNLHSGYEFSVQYLEPLSLEEFAIWENLSGYLLT
ncbi:hypothetical protein GAYE_SCF13G3501 [Galdieria yellowstonensis]|uniref:Uncharacterized protein n=1 Tax=Galdieria yellowstonensis TaxID=3028027 RepID=A0AAV9IDY0_9RHOD|nr:hypothetical protein GAYE_SCF13G3501 [Galdieria yellowstonensis]